MPRPVDYLSTVTALQQVLQGLELSLDKARAEEENEWKIRYDVHLRFKRCLEMRTHRSLERIKYLREALRDGGLEYHRDYWMTPEHAIARRVYDLERVRKEKAAEIARKEALLERDAKILKEERNRRRLLQQEVEDLKVGPDSLPWTRTGQRLLNEARDDTVNDPVDEVLHKSAVTKELDELERQITRETRHRLPRI
ncbi:hypothetical protein BV898_11457 [Hypsibius exemplaris]|uniref:Uncharacterized protein n=1 Tax=Hypsibius exemplaris TaxID=2072580 RepID=A0A1W0WGL7_HYPEX|nr:hypothetical protein BV898_11457 [Hypsibius exemplaris]